MTSMIIIKLVKRNNQEKEVNGRGRLDRGQNCRQGASTSGEMRVEGRKDEKAPLVRTSIYPVKYEGQLVKINYAIIPNVSGIQR